MRKFSGLAVDTSQPRMNAPQVARSRSLFPRHVATWVRTCADYYAAAALYEQLSRLSDAELHRRGLSCEHLGREVCAACDRAAHGESL
jgi:hypothetical protein